MPLKETLDAIFDADRTMREEESNLLAHSNTNDVQDLLSGAVQDAAALEDRVEAAMRLMRLADLCAQTSGPKMVDALIEVLNTDEPQVRVAAGEAIRDVGYERYAEVARGIERALANQVDGPAMTELPWVLAEIGEPSALSLIREFLGHANAEVIAAGIEALAQLGNPQAIEALNAFTSDTREVTIEEFEEETKTTLAMLAAEAIEMLSAAQTND